MLNKLKKHLALMYTISIAVIFFIVLVIAYLFTLFLINQQSMDRFYQMADSLANNLASSAMINTSELSLIQQKNRCILEILDNGIPISYQGQPAVPLDAPELLSSLKQAAVSDGIIAANQPQYTYIKRSRAIKLHGRNGEDYLGCVIMIPKDTDYLCLSILYSRSLEASILLRYGILYLALGVFGIFIVHLISNYCIAKTLQPVAENQVKQVDFIAAASHELRSPLTYIQAASNSLVLDCLPYLEGEPADALSDYLHNTEDECQRMKKLIEDMLLLASADKKTWTLKKQMVDADNFFIDCYDKLSVYSNKEHHSINLNLPDEFLGNLEFDPNRIYQILQILINNAISYTPAESEIMIHPSLADKYLMIEVIDHGPGIPDEQKQRIFERYYRGDASRNDKSHYGLGLNIAHEIAKLHDGTLDLHDTPGGGCTFLLKIKCR